MFCLVTVVIVFFIIPKYMPNPSLGVVKSNISTTPQNNEKAAGDKIDEAIVKKDANEEKVSELYNKIKNNFSEFDSTQLEFYAQTAAKNIMTPCEEREDKNNCISAVAFAVDNFNFCSEINDKDTIIKCSNKIFSENDQKINRCNSANEDEKMLCLMKLFLEYDRIKDCGGLIKKDQDMCAGILYYRLAAARKDPALCGNIIDVPIRLYCEKSLAEKNGVLILKK